MELDTALGDPDVGKLYQYNLHSALTNWSPNIMWVGTHFLTATNLLLETATADLLIKKLLAPWFEHATSFN